MLNFEIPADVPEEKIDEYIKNMNEITGGTGRLMLFAGDQKVEHLNDDFYGEGIPLDDAHPEHLFRIASLAKIGVFATQMGLIARYGRKYPTIPYLVKINSKTNLVPYEIRDPISLAWYKFEQVLDFKEKSGLKIYGIGYTVYLGSEFEHKMLKQAAQLIYETHQQGMVAVLWMYPKGKAIKDEHDPHLIAGAAGVANCLGADFVKLKVPYKEGHKSAEALKEAVLAAGNTGVLCEGGKKEDPEQFLRELYEQIHIGGARGNGTGRNIHQNTLEAGIKMANAIYAITVENKTVEEALKILKEEIL
ncbi:fructose-bisphosphate aldolase [Persephonella hydrogeniphila]|uniref:fructose-bisphosphate aldolase n=1 Tax=Persephonella hydrogeniphila TaxID=198703 RepID=A0A285NFH8_9AQUI|nr:aldolase [Persephonella hydrogeniphila]SNZ06411.1 fructose-bisphosphate aldolase [Persephonella hydrogeniphila]